MKQHITVKQLDKLDEKEKLQLRKWWEKHKKDEYILASRICKEHILGSGEKVYVDIHGWQLPLLSIGQMIEFIVDYGENWRLDGALTGAVINPCDDLWEDVKEILEK
jgi:hypothetical protein